MKHFWIYTGLRLVLFAATWGVVLGAWVLVTGDAPVLLTLLIAFAISGVGSYYVLAGPREKFARSVQGRADRASARIEERSAKEDED